jgi:hypothetical protein
MKNQKKSDYGMLGVNDSVQQDLKLPWGLNGVFNQLMKQVEKELSQIDPSVQKGGMPKGFKIQISSGKPVVKQIGMPVRNPEKKEEPKLFPEEDVKISRKESARRSKLPKVSAESNVRRLPEAIVYEISAPGVSSKKEVVLSKLEEGFEVRAYSKDKCYVKTIPLKVEILHWEVEKGKVFVELKN